MRALGDSLPTGALSRPHASHAAWDCPGGVKGSDQVTGSTAFYGIKEDKSLKYIDQTTAWKK